jgi:hypothetical protein
MDNFPPLSARETERMVYRVGLFGRRGVDETMADMLADALVIRDRDQDTRRACVECSNFRKGNDCGSPIAKTLPASVRPFSPGPTLLHRCAGFSWQVPA